MIDFLIFYVPSILFLVIFLTGLLMGLKRGFRKSVILAIHALVAFLICLIAYIIVVNQESTDAQIVSIVNTFMGENQLQLKMGVSPSNTTLTAILTEFIPKQMEFGDGVALILQDNGAYLQSIVFQVYRLIFALIFIIFYLILVFILYLVYVIFYPDRRHYKKLRKKLESQEIEDTNVDNGEATKDKLAFDIEQDSDIDEPINDSAEVEYNLCPKEDSVSVDDEMLDESDTESVDDEITEELDSNETAEDNNNQEALEFDNIDSVEDDNSFDESENLESSEFQEDNLDASDTSEISEEAESLDEVDFNEEQELSNNADSDDFENESDEFLASDNLDEDMDDVELKENLDEEAFKDENIELLDKEEKANKKNKSKVDKPVNLKKIGKRRRWIGMIIGGVRGFTSGLIVLALIGALFYIVSGTGKNKYEENYLEGTQYSQYFDIYKALGEYGNHGMYAVLNSITDKEDFPYYLYLVDVIYSGNTEDPEVGRISYNMSKEIGNFTEFSRSAIDLLFKYSGDDIRSVMNGNSNKDMMQVLTDTFKNPEFKAEFDVLIDGFDAGTYFLNMSLSFITSFVNHLDQLKLKDSMPDDAYEAICIMFKKGYLTDYIVSEKTKKEAIALNPALADELEPEAYLSIRNLISKDDVKEMLNVFVDIMSLESNEDSTQNILAYSNVILPSIKKLSILSTDKKDTMNPVLKRLYKYLEARYLEESFVKLNSNLGKTPSNRAYIENYINSFDENEDIDWIDELHNLLDVASDALALYGNIYQTGENDIIKMIADEFDTVSETREESLTSLASIKGKLSESKLLDAVLSSNGIYLTILNFLKNTFVEDAYLTTDINYLYVDENNKGEIYNLLTGIEAIVKNENEREILTSISSMGDQSDTVSTLNTLKLLINSIDSDLDTILESDILNSIVSSYLIANKTIDSSMNLEFYIPDTILEKVDGNTVNLIDKAQIKTLFSTFNSLLDGIIPYMDPESEDYQNIDVLISSLDTKKLKDSVILKGTLSNVVISLLSDNSLSDYVLLPDEYKDVESWIDSEEIINIINAMKDTSLEISVFTETYKTDDERTKAITNMISSLKSDDITTILSSDILYLTISKTLSNDKIVSSDVKRPNEIFETTSFNDNGQKVTAISKTEINSLLTAVTKLDIDLADIANLDINALIKTLNDKDDQNKSKLDYCYDSLILVSTLSDQVKSNGNIVVPNKASENGLNYTIDNIQYKSVSKSELSKVVAALTALDIDLNKMDEMSVNSLVSKLENNISTVYASDIIKATIASKVDDASSDLVIPMDAYEFVYNTDKTLDFRYISESEMYCVVRILNNKDLGLDLDNLNFDSFNLNSNNISYLVESLIILATMYSKIKDYDTIVIPDTALAAEDKHIYDVSEDNMYLSCDELSDFLTILSENRVALGLAETETSPIKLSEEALANLAVDNLTFDVIKGALDSDIIHATVILNIALNKDTNEIIIPTNTNENYLEDASREKLETNFHSNIWYTSKEVSKMIIGLGYLIGTNKSIGDIGSSFDNLNDVVKPLNDVVSGENKTRLELICNSVIMKNTLSYNLLKINDIIIPYDAKNIDACTYELNNELHSINLVKQDEISNLISILNDTDLAIDLDNPSFDELNLTNTNIELISSSKILRATVNDKLGSADKLVIPDSVLTGKLNKDTNERYLSKDEIKKFLNIVLTNKVKLGLAATETSPIKLSEEALANLAVDNLTFDVIKGALDSDIIHATVILNIALNKDTNEIIIPTNTNENYLEAASREKLETNFHSNIWVDNKETTKMIDGIGYLIGFNKTIGDLGSSFDNLNNVVKPLNDVVSGENKTRLELICNSVIMENTLSYNLLKINDITIPYDAKYSSTNTYELNNVSHEINVVMQDEISNLISILNDTDLAIDLDNPSFDELNLTNTNIKLISSSKILRATVYVTIKDVNEIVIPNVSLDGTLYKGMSDKYLNEEETKSFLTILLDNKVELGLAANADAPIELSEEALSTKLKVENIKVSVLHEFVESNILHATIIYNIRLNKDEFEIIIQNNEGANYLDDSSRENLVSNFYSNIWYTTDEATNMINALSNFLGVDGKVSDFADMGTNINNLVKPLNDVVIESSNETKLDLIYKSVVMEKTLAYRITKIETLKIPYDSYTTEFSYELIDESYTLFSVAKEDIKVLIDVLNDETLALDLDTINLNDLNLTEENTSLIASSKIMRSTIYKFFIEDVTDELVIPVSTLSGHYSTEEDMGYVTQEALEALMDNLIKYKATLGIVNEYNHIDVGNINIEISNFSIDILKDMIENSDIMHATAINKISVVTGITVSKTLKDEAERDYLIFNYETTSWYNNKELSNLIAAMEELEISNVSDAEELNVDSKLSVITNEKIYTCYKSEIMKLTLSSKVNSITKLVKPENAYEEDEVQLSETESIRVILEEEFVNLIAGIKSCDDSPSLSSGANITLNANSCIAIPNSLILNATITDSIIANENVYVPSSVVSDYVTIDETELSAFLNALLTGFGVSNVSTGIGASTVSPNNMQNKDAILASIIMRSTISANINSDATSYIYINNSLVTVEERYNHIDSYIPLVEKSELSNLLDVLTTGDSFDVDITVAKIISLQTSDIIKYMKSNILALKISEVLINNAGYKSIVDNVATYNLDNGTTYALKYVAPAYYLKDPLIITVKDILDVEAASITKEILTVDDVLAYKYYVASHS